MNRNLIQKSYNTENLVVEFCDSALETETIVFLKLCFYRIFDNLNAPFLIYRSSYAVEKLIGIST